MREAHLRDFVAVIGCGSVRLAARSLGISEAAVSKNLTALERSVGVPLLIRSSHGVEATEHGKLVLRRARVIDAELRKLDEELAMLSGAEIGTNVSIGVSSTAEAIIMPRAVRRFRESAPHTTVTIISGPPSATVSALREARVDFVIAPASEGVVGPDIHAERLLSTDMVVVARRGHPLEHSSDIDALARCEWVLGARRSETERALTHALRAHGRPEIRFPIQRDSFNALLHLLLQSDLLAVASLPTVAVFRDAGILSIVPAPFTLEPMVQHLITASGRPLSLAARMLADECRRTSRACRR
ncbi:Galactose-binding protein regulator (plasmid) [Variovorax sp. SRS16]|uniref:LysR family transcriptional regulator n=1 Tax=Variovorax sp. SRS16 TaxID=282217 RepID=UPI0013192CD3|nr:LysR family transcriptional regulator [Variovorax sp. SRS16]VTU46323.1 Galactose-binding protein regulator [Variovorax sp. SRS16]